MKKTYKNKLEQVFSNRARAEIMRLLFDGRLIHMHLRELARSSGFAIRTIQTEVEKMQKMDLLVLARDGNRLRICANDQHVLYTELSSIVAKTIGYRSQLEAALSQFPLKVAFIFGSVAKGEEKASSDLDLMIVGKIGLRDLASKLKKISLDIGREINPHIYSPQTWHEKLEKKDHFISRVLEEERIFLVGDENVLSSLA